MGTRARMHVSTSVQSSVFLTCPKERRNAGGQERRFVQSTVQEKIN